MTDEEALLAAILAEPKDDTPRLVYADCLAEHDQPERAEFIRVQVELARLPNGRYGCRKCTSPAVVECAFTEEECCCKYKPRVADLRRRERELWDQYIQGRQEEWFPGWHGWSLAINRNAMGERQSGLAARGFITFMALDWADWRTHADAILKQQPIERVRLTTMPNWNEEGPPEFVGAEDDRPRRCGISRWPKVEFELPQAGAITFRGHSLVTRPVLG